MKIFYLPDLGEGLAEAEIREWYIKEGEVVKVDQPLVSMETAKAVLDVPSPYTGRIVKLHGHVNDVIKTGAPLISFETEESIQDQSKGSVVGSLEESSNKWDESEVIIGSAVKQTTTSIKAMPAARVLAKQLQVDLKDVTPSGAQGLITPEDVKKLIAHKKSAQDFQEGESLHGVRRVMATIMAQSHQEIAPVSIVDDADITRFGSNSDITVHLLKGIVHAIKLEPVLNAWFDGKTLKRQVISHVHIGLAMDTAEGLFVPVIRDTEQHSEEQLRQLIEQFKKKIKDRSITPTEMQGATITLSNFGMMGGRYATPIIVPPMVAILGCGRGRDAVLPYQGQVSIRRILPLSLTVDHRAVTGGEAARFLRLVIDYLEKDSN